MGKYNLGVASTELNNTVNSNRLYMNEAKAKPLAADIEKQLEVIRVSLSNINALLNKSVSSEVVKGSRAETFKGWAKKAKSQATAVEKIKKLLSEKYAEDAKNYPIQLLDDRIAELEKKLSEISK